MLYNNARGLLYTSIYEGFGIPVLEAQKAGLPVIAFNGSSIPEVGGDAVIYFNNDDIDEIKECIVKLEDDNLFAQLSKEGIENAKHFSWEKNYQETLALYKNYDK